MDLTIPQIHGSNGTTLREKGKIVVLEQRNILAQCSKILDFAALLR